MNKLPKTSGIYTITNLLDNKIYLGYAKNLKKRANKHFVCLRNKNHANIHLQNAVNKYGIENFVFELLEECEEQFLPSQEHYWSNMLNVHNDKYGYNIRPTHPYIKNISTKEMIIKAQKTKRKRAGERGYWFTSDVIKKLGHKWTEEEKIEISRKNKGLKRSAETCKKISVSKTGTTKPREEIERGQKTKRRNLIASGWVPKVKLPRVREHSRKVRLFLENGEIKDFESISACMDYLGITRRVISKILYKSAKKPKFKIEFIWKNC